MAPSAQKRQTSRLTDSSFLFLWLWMAGRCQPGHDRWDGKDPRLIAFSYRHAASVGLFCLWNWTISIREGGLQTNSTQPWQDEKKRASRVLNHRCARWTPNTNPLTYRFISSLRFYFALQISSFLVTRTIMLLLTRTERRFIFRVLYHFSVNHRESLERDDAEGAWDRITPVPFRGGAKQIRRVDVWGVVGYKVQEWIVLSWCPLVSIPSSLHLFFFYPSLSQEPLIYWPAGRSESDHAVCTGIDVRGALGHR